jgi:hypothetical protein
LYKIIKKENIIKNNIKEFLKLVDGYLTLQELEKFIICK